MTLHQAEWLAGEIIAGVLLGHAILWARRRFRSRQDGPGRGETTQHSSTQDD